MNDVTKEYEEHFKSIAIELEKEITLMKTNLVKLKNAIEERMKSNDNTLQQQYLNICQLLKLLEAPLSEINYTQIYSLYNHIGALPPQLYTTYSQCSPVNLPKESLSDLFVKAGFNYSEEDAQNTSDKLIHEYGEILKKADHEDLVNAVDEEAKDVGFLIERLKQVVESIKDDEMEVKRRVAIEGILKQYSEGKLKYHELITSVIAITEESK